MTTLSLRRFALLLGIPIWAVFILFGCASAKTTKKAAKVKRAPVLVGSSAKKMPSWVTSIPEEKEYFYFVGTSGDLASFDEGKKTAVGDALGQVVSVIGVTVSAATTIEERYFAEQYQTTISAELLSEGRAKLQDAEIIEIYYEQYAAPDGSTFFRVWVLLKYGKKEIEREQERLAAVLKLKYGELTALEGKAEQLAKDHRIVDAVISHFNAGLAALEIEDGKVFFDRNMNRAEELLLKLRLKKSGENQTGYIGEPLKEPLRLRVFYEGGGKEIPVPGVPIRFSYHVPKAKSEGYKVVVQNALTDAGGNAEFRVDSVFEVSDSNRVEAALDMEAQLRQLEAVPDEYLDRVRRLRDIEELKRVTFLFKSDTRARSIKTGIFFTQLDADGRPIPGDAAAPAAYDVLFEKKFSVQVLSPGLESTLGKPAEEAVEILLEGSPHELERVIVGSVRILGYEKIAGYESAQAEAFATLFEAETRRVLRTWEVRRSGTGSSRESAGASALREAGKALGTLMSRTMP